LGTAFSRLGFTSTKEQSTHKCPGYATGIVYVHGRGFSRQEGIALYHNRSMLRPSPSLVGMSPFFRFAAVGLPATKAIPYIEFVALSALDFFLGNMVRETNSDFMEREKRSLKYKFSFLLIKNIYLITQKPPVKPLSD
jgi:hypothetical protein